MNDEIVITRYCKSRHYVMKWFNHNWCHTGGEFEFYDEALERLIDLQAENIEEIYTIKTIAGRMKY